MSNFSRINLDKIFVDVKFHWSKEEYKKWKIKEKIIKMRLLQGKNNFKWWRKFQNYRKK